MQQARSIYVQCESSLATQRDNIICVFSRQDLTPTAVVCILDGQEASRGNMGIVNLDGLFNSFEVERSVFFIGNHSWVNAT
mmetsp:Transcript_2770/g.6723  ORF Transcript_2770/g.6723 Transcript_2770/m.6723 type:complete len:81 (-) Transcript_2770:425-667(-)